MYPFHKIMLSIILIMVPAVARLLQVRFDDALLSDAMTLIGILFGFTITAAVAISGSQFIVTQHKIVDQSVKGCHKSNAQRLVDYLEFACGLDIFLLVVLIVLRLNIANIRNIQWMNFLLAGLLLQAIYASYLVLQIVMKYVRSSWKES